MAGELMFHGCGFINEGTRGLEAFIFHYRGWAPKVINIVTDCHTSIVAIL